MLSPATADEAAALLKAADGPVEIRGAGTKQQWGGRLAPGAQVLSTLGLTGVIEHAAGDLIVVVRAGTRLTELQEKLATHGQQLALDPVVADATVGGTVAANVSGPRRMLYGTARDLVIGTTVVLADGTIARSGGKVVKNVAGYDLGKLFTGSYGTLGLVTELAFRLHPLGAASAYVTGPLSAAALQAVRDAQVVPSAVEIDAAAGEVCVLVEGTTRGVDHRAATLARVLGGELRKPEWWGLLPWRDDQLGVKISTPLSQVPALTRWPVRGSAGTGVLYAAIDPDELPGLRAAAEHVVVVTAPAVLRDGLDLWGPLAGLELMRRVKRQFDPDGRFAAGRFAGGI